MILGMEVGLSPGDCVIWVPRSPPQKGGGDPKIFSTLMTLVLHLCSACNRRTINFYMMMMMIVAKRLDGSRWYLA